jgi:RNase H-like domain found in reverse transcriptase
MTEAPVLAHFDRKRQTVVETDVSDFVMGVVMSQIGDNGQWHPVAFFSKNLLSAECNYKIYGKELLAIFTASEQWAPDLELCEYPFEVITDHKALGWLITTKKLSRRQARWSEYLTRFDFKIVYRSGRLNQEADDLTRRLQDRPQNDEDLRRKEQMRTILKPWMLSNEGKIDLSPSTKKVAPINDEDDSQQTVLDKIKKANRGDSEEMVQVRG